ncbi:MAG TPA: uroporphyrinogen-III C-methyltransferase [Bacilli bacterium]
MGKGKVFLVGAGPGDPKLITLKGMEAIQKADVIVYDRLASPRLLRNLKEGAKTVYVGKLPDRHTMKQEEINQLLVDLALAGNRVVRLKGGDPTIFGRVGEEAEQLVQHGIEFEIVPGISSAIAVPAYAGIPVTHRDFASSLAIITGHEDPAKLDTSINWEKLSTGSDTLIFLMGVAKIKYIRDQLIRWGRAPQTPVALIRWGTRIEQETLIGTLENIAELVKAADFQPPAVIIVGEVVKLRDKLAWFEKKPLFGARILVPRARSQSGELADLIEELGGEAVEFPVIQIQPPTKQEALDKMDEVLRELSVYDWAIFTSVNGVDYFFRRLSEKGVDIRSLSKARIAAVGPKTAAKLLSHGLQVETLPDQFKAEGLLASLLPSLSQGQRVLLPRANIAHKDLPDKLKQLGLLVKEIDVYETVLSTENAGEVIEMLQQGEIHAVAFTSSSTVTNLIKIISQQGIGNPLELLGELDLVCIGPVTAQTALEHGLTVKLTAEAASIASLVEALIQGRNQP